MPSGFAAVRSKDNALTVMLISKGLSGVTPVMLNIGNFTARNPVARPIPASAHTQKYRASWDPRTWAGRAQPHRCLAKVVGGVATEPMDPHPLRKQAQPREPASMVMAGMFNNRVPKKGERYTPEDSFFMMENPREHYTPEF